VLLAQIGTPSSSTGHARVIARIRVTNRNEVPLALDGAERSGLPALGERSARR